MIYLKEMQITHYLHYLQMSALNPYCISDVHFPSQMFPFVEASITVVMSRRPHSRLRSCNFFFFVKVTLCQHDESCAHYILVCNVMLQIQKEWSLHLNLRTNISSFVSPSGSLELWWIYLHQLPVTLISICLLISPFQIYQASIGILLMILVRSLKSQKAFKPL